jgi:hypothetical protein
MRATGCNQCWYSPFVGGQHQQVWGGYNSRPLHTRDWEPVTITLQALSLVEKVEPVQVRHFTLRSRDQRSMWMQDGCKVYLDSYMASNGSCFIVTLTVFKNHLLEVGLTQNREIMAIQTLTTVDLFYFFVMILEVSWDKPLDTFFWALTISWSRLLARVWHGPNSRPLHTRAKSYEHEIVRAQKKCPRPSQHNSKTM